MYDNLNGVGRHSYIPEEAFLFMPTYSGSDQVNDDFKIGDGKRTRRLIFEGWASDTYTQFEQQQLAELDAYFKKKQVSLDTRWTRCWQLRWMQSTGFDVKQCYSDMLAYEQYQQRVSNLKMNQDVHKWLKSGIFYIGGRDCHYRPIMVFDVKKMVDMDLTEEALLATQTYFFEYVLKNLLIPGQVENWVALIDAGYVSVFSLVGSTKECFKFLSSTFRCRMFAAYVVQCPNSIYWAWSIAKKFLQEETINKFNFFDQSVPEPLLQYCNPSQLERKYGGTLQDITNFWPPVFVGSNYQCTTSPTRLLTSQEYAQLHNKKKLHNTRIHEGILHRAQMQTRTGSKRSAQEEAEIRLDKLEQQYLTQRQQMGQEEIPGDRYPNINTGLTAPMGFRRMFY